MAEVDTSRETRRKAWEKRQVKILESRQRWKRESKEHPSSIRRPVIDLVPRYPKEGTWIGSNAYSKIKVLSEWRTLERVLNGCSLSRYGDGEIKHMDGKRNVSQIYHSDLSRALNDVFDSRIRNHLVAIPNVYNNRSFESGVQEKYVDSMRRRFGKRADPKRTYGSSYVTRADLCAYLDWPSYWAVVSELWMDRDVVLVRGNPKRANPVGMMDNARDLMEIEIPNRNAWSCYREILRECLRMSSFCRYLICAGPTATVLAYDLAVRGRHAVDIGHLGLFYGRWVGGLAFTTPKDIYDDKKSQEGEETTGKDDVIQDREVMVHAKAE